MGMFLACINLQIFQQNGTQSRAGQHTLYGFFDQERRLFRKVVYGGSETLTTGIPCVSRVDLVGHLFARELHFLGIDYDNIVAAIRVGSVAGLVLNLGESSRICEARRPNTSPFASISTHSLVTVAALAEIVL